MELLAAYAPWQIGAALVVALGSAYVRGLTGFGMAILLVPILALALPPVEAVLLANFLSLFIGLSEAPRLIRGAEKSAWRIAGLVVLFTPLGLYGLSVTSADLARFLIALIALSAFIAVLLPKRSGEEPGAIATGGVGVLSGLMTGYAGMPGPPVVPYYVSRDIPRETAKTSMMLIFTIASFAGLVSGAALGLLAWRLPLLAALLFPAVLIGNRLGDLSSGKIGDTLWRAAVGVILGGAALAALVRLV